MQNTSEKLFTQQKLQASTLFELSNINLFYKKFHALKNINLQVEKGQILFITGASGAGKTSLLKLIGGEVKPTSGKVISFSKDLFTTQIFQDLKLFPKRTCRENLEMAYDRKVYKNRMEFREDLEELSKILGIYNFLELKISETNGGLKQKIAFLRAILARPDVIIADEPTCSLDTDNARKIYDILNLYNVRRGLTVIWATHNKELIKSFSGKIVHLDQGKLVYSGHACFI